MPAPEIKKTGEQLLDAGDRIVNDLELLVPGAENSDRKVILVKGLQAYQLFKELVNYYAAVALMELVKTNKLKKPEDLLNQLPASLSLQPWVNAGGQLIPGNELNKFLQQVSKGPVKSWGAVHKFYKKQAGKYPLQKLQHALAALQAVHSINLKKDPNALKRVLQQSVYTKEWMVKGIYDSRAKDYSNPFRKMVYENRAEMDIVTGKLESNGFIKQEEENLAAYKKSVQNMLKLLK